MKWKYVLLALLGLLILVPSVLYFGSLDWSRKHSHRVAALPIFNKNADSGEYRLKVGTDEFLIRVAGMQNKGPNVVLLHGFPESSIMWNRFAKQAAQEDYRILAFDQRGYSPGARPSNITDYQIDNLAKDVINVANEIGFDNFHLVGHDWGAVVGWKTVMDFPSRVLTWTAMSIPHPAVFLNAVLNDSIQKQRSSYFKLFQRPIVPEFLLMYGNQKTYKKLMGIAPKENLDEYLSIVSEPGAFTAELNWYRALDVEKLIASKTLEINIATPTLFIWGKTDAVISPSIIPNQQKYMKGPHKELSLDTGHALIQNKENEVTEAILAHFRQ